VAKSLVELTVEIIQGQTSKKQMTTEEIANALKDTFQALKSLQDSEVSSGIEPDTLETNKFIDPKKSIQRNKVVCLECGQEFKMLSGRHLASHGLDSKTYRKKYGFTARQPLCAKSLSEVRSAGAKARGIPENLQKAIAARTKKINTAEGGNGTAE